MAAHSIGMLRKYNQSIPVVVLHIRDGRSHGAGMTKEEFWRHCDAQSVKVVQLPELHLPGEEGYTCMHRTYFQTLMEDEVLYIDSDTFIFGDVATIFDKYQVDFAACPARWAVAKGYQNTLKVFPFCSGVHLWKKGHHREWAKALPDISKELRERRHPISEWLYQIDERCYNREEFTMPIFLERSGLSYRYFERQDVMLLETEEDFDNMRSSTIFHCYTPQWSRVMSMLEKKRRVFFRPNPY